MTKFNAYIDYDLRDGSYSYEEKPEWDNGHPFAVHHGLVVRFSLPTGYEYDEDEALKWFREEFGERVEFLREGGDVEWDGNNHVWQYESEARSDAADEIVRAINDEILDDYYPIGKAIYDAADWYLSGLASYEGVAEELGITAESTDEDLEQAAELARVSESDNNGRPIVLTGLDEFLERVRQVMAESDEEDEG